ncbi:glycosyltransferase family 4 protein [Cryptosporangium sp. NPDC048952]|uniref:glycosyltransferase family 4 protein n=1 Tax=Cryptosporangium sp. NPDC048952 TaxID=3363961 RepID=UPI00371BC9A3
MTDTYRVARYYETVRTAHLERLAEFTPGWLLYERVQYDWDDELAARSPGLKHATFPQVLAFALRAPIGVLEVNEPLALTMWPKLVALSWALCLRRVTGRGRVELVAYCIENFDPVTKLRYRTRLPRLVAAPLVVLGMAIVGARFSRLAFGTDDAYQVYARSGGAGWRFLSGRARVFPALPAPAQASVEKVPGTVGFLGALDGRKGSRQLVAAWPLIAGSMPDATLLIMGKGPDAVAVGEWAATRDEVCFRPDPGRAIIRRGLAELSVLVLLSQPGPMWKEQVGLPIVEGLAHGCEIVASTETGLATWLQQHGHAVLAPDCSTSELAAAVVKRLQGARPSSAITGALPAEDGRLSADRWLMGAR